jgi:hypothetical protein
MPGLETKTSAIVDFISFSARGLCIAIGIFGAFASLFVGSFSFGSASAIFAFAAGITPHSKVLTARFCLAFSILGVLLQVADLVHYLISLSIPGNYYSATYFFIVVGALSGMAFVSLKKSRASPDAI